MTIDAKLFIILAAFVMFEEMVGTDAAEHQCGRGMKRKANFTNLDCGANCEKSCCEEDTDLCVYWAKAFSEECDSGTNVTSDMLLIEGNDKASCCKTVKWRGCDHFHGSAGSCGADDAPCCPDGYSRMSAGGGGRFELYEKSLTTYFGDNTKAIDRCCWEPVPDPADNPNNDLCRATMPGLTCQQAQEGYYLPISNYKKIGNTFEACCAPEPQCSDYDCTLGDTKPYLIHNTTFIAQSNAKVSRATAWEVGCCIADPEKCGSVTCSDYLMINEMDKMGSTEAECCRTKTCIDPGPEYVVPWFDTGVDEVSATTPQATASFVAMIMFLAASVSP